MAETYNDNDELGQLLGWLKTNGPALAAGLILGLIVVVGWKWWQAHLENQAQAAAQLYGSFVQEIQTGDVSEQATADASQLKQDFSGSPYAANAAFRLAALAVKNDNYDQALGQLDWVLANSDSVPTKNLARLRKARALWADDQGDAALQLLEKKHSASFERLYAELVGDIHAARGERADAHAAYQKAAEAAGNAGQVLQRKLAQTAAADAASVTTTAAKNNTEDEGA